MGEDGQVKETPELEEEGAAESGAESELKDEAPPKAKTAQAPDLTENALRVLERRYLKKDDTGQPIEDPEEMFRRVAGNIAGADTFYDPEADLDSIAEKFYDEMRALRFIPNSPTLMNAGRELQQLSACFVLPIEDSMDSIFESLKNAALIHKSGGGTGFSFSRIRPKNDVVASTRGVSSGPISFMSVFDSATETIKQGGTRRGANMGILRVDHPDVEEFIKCKQENDKINNFNLSVALTERFMEAVKYDEDFDLVNPHDRRLVRSLKAKTFFKEIVKSAHHNGEPGIIFIDRINQDNPTPHVGAIESTNPCGEQPLLPYESCNLGSINLSRFVRYVPADSVEGPDGASRPIGHGGVHHDPEPYSGEDDTSGMSLRGPGIGGGNLVPEIDFPMLHDTIRSAVHFLDNVIDMNNYPLPEIEQMTKANRKIGLGVMGFTDMLIKLGIPYNSPAAVKTAEKVMSYINRESKKASEVLANKRGVFPNFPGSRYDQDGLFKVRNATTTTIAPTGTISIIANASSGVEPLFAISYIRNVMDNDELIEVNPLFEEVARKMGFHSGELMKKIAEKGGLQELDEVPDEIKRVFVTAHEIEPKWHIKIQAAFQRHTDNAVSKTINFPKSATRKDVEAAYMLAYDLGCKGVTIYRDGSRDEQVLSIGKQKRGEGAKEAVERPLAPRPRPAVTLGVTRKIPTACGNIYVTLNEDDTGQLFEVFTQMGKSGGCIRCPQPHISEYGQVLSCPDAIAGAIKRHMKGEDKTKRATQVQQTPTLDKFESAEDKMKAQAKRLGNVVGICPECTSMLFHEEGCMKCHDCGFSKCG
jgi:ribonucleoside-diphosphate reductase alpha chain